MGRLRFYDGIAKSAAISFLVVTLLLCGTVSVAYGQGFFDKTCPRCNGTGYIARIHRTDHSASWAGWSSLRVRATFYNDGPEGVYRTVKCYTEQRGSRVDEESFSQYFPVGYTTVTRNLYASGWYRVTYNMYVPNPNVVCPECDGKGYVTDSVKVGATVFGVVLIAVVGIVMVTRKKPEAPKITPPSPLPPPSAPGPPPSPPLSYCPYCRSEITDPSSLYCEKCGQKIS